ncbi:carboxypeptidase-like regulatory domain-containing protein [Anthocerotibacter panamensis]|uniref:carboxypeptidase-like regulatory domain-containing protein n=1 Tax=Anthocerotibacter panamensis TaxID=2857077 RepID=UPI001C40599E|nr:carboxypeptidase-like regulatory domain-containing protein [Anthocerotibacter panamensis]
MRIFCVPLLALTLLGMAPVQAEAIYGRVYDTLKGKTFPNTRVVLGSNPKLETTTDQDGSYWFHGVKPGPYLIYLYPAGREVIGRLVVYKAPTTIGNLDLAKIEAPETEDAY